MLKSYDTPFERNYQNEIEAYSSFANAKSSENILGCLGSYRVQPLAPGSGLQYTIMLEYAERGSLLQLYGENDPPFSFAETKAFWSSLLQIATALVIAHNVAPTKQGASWYVLTFARSRMQLTDEARPSVFTKTSNRRTSSFSIVMTPLPRIMT